MGKLRKTTFPNLKPLCLFQHLFSDSRSSRCLSAPLAHNTPPPSAWPPRRSVYPALCQFLFRSLVLFLNSPGCSLLSHTHMPLHLGASTVLSTRRSPSTSAGPSQVSLHTGPGPEHSTEGQVVERGLRMERGPLTDPNIPGGAACRVRLTQSPMSPQLRQRLSDLPPREGVTSFTL